jgi:signal transduction histidine kinase
VADRGDEDIEPLMEGRALWRTLARVAASGSALAALVFVGGRTIVDWQLGDDHSALARLESRVTRDLVDDASRLQRVARILASSDVVLSGLDQPAEARLFDHLAQASAPTRHAVLALTVFDAAGHATAWSGRASRLPLERVQSGSSLFVAPGPPGLRLVAIEPVLSKGQGGQRRRLGSVAAEAAPSKTLTDPSAEEFTVASWLGPVSLRRAFADRPQVSRPGQFIVRSSPGEALLEASVAASAPAETRARWQHRGRAVALTVLGVTALLCAATLVLARGRPGTWSPAGSIIGSLALIAGARVLFWIATPPHMASTEAVHSGLAYASVLLRGLHRSPLDLLLSALTAAAMVVVLVAPIRAAILSVRGRRATFPGGFSASIAPWLVQLAAGAAVWGLELGVLALVRDTTENASADLLRLAVLPWNPPRLALLVSLILWQAAAFWAAVLVCRGALAFWRPDRRSPLRWLLPAAWMLPSVIYVAFVRGGSPAAPILLMAAAVAGTAWITRRGIPWYRHGSQAARLGYLLLALLIPAWFLYPALGHYVDRTKRQLVQSQYGPQVRNHVEELQSRLGDTIHQIDHFPELDNIVRSLSQTADRPSPEAAFAIWRTTDLEEFRLTSAVELYDARGDLASRFALNFTEADVVPLRYRSRSCSWEIFGEAVPFGAAERTMLHAERGICGKAAGGQVKPSGAIVVHLMLDYSALPFISSQSPYYEFIRASRRGTAEGTPASDIELAIYGWGRSLLYSSSNRAWNLPDDVFRQAYRTREPFWTVLQRGGGRDRVFLSNDRNGIYVLGYPVPTLFNHLVRLAELSTLAVLTFLGLMALAGLARRLSRVRPYPAHLLVREFRTSFYRKLFLAFVAAAVIPVIAMALLVRAYFAHQLHNDVEVEAARTALVARRVIEESVALQQREVTIPTAALSDDVMVWISRVINQDVNIFDGPELLVTSERDLFASGLLPTRTPDDVYRAIAIERLPTYVGRDQIGDFDYLVAAAPVRVGSRNDILTVPLASRQRDIDREIDELDRGIHLGALLLILLGAGIGYWMAERIGDPVQRLTRATRRIAAGDLGARVIVRTADELQRLVEAFNRMAGELQRQRSQLERTNRLEAWAEMARQVAHDIKNPLTPIQLSAEHLQRVHRDSGSPLGLVLDNCVDTILGQVRLLRQIASEFSSFGSAPSPRPTPTSLSDLLHDVIEPYRLGLNGRVRFDLDVPPALPPLSMDRALIGRALTNVIENALHAMPGGGSLTISAHQRSDAVDIALTDTGVGMDEESTARIFEPYFSTKATGTGLGLSIARRNVELHGGRIAVASQRGAGTTVTITLPVDGGR